MYNVHNVHCTLDSGKIFTGAAWENNILEVIFSSSFVWLAGAFAYFPFLYSAIVKLIIVPDYTNPKTFSLSFGA